MALPTATNTGVTVLAVFDGPAETLKTATPAGLTLT